MRAVRGFAALACGLILVGCASGAPRNSAGQLTAPASIGPFQITIGDCTGAMKEGDVSSLQVVPCDQKHRFEAYAFTNLSGDSFPGEAEVTKQADKFCAAEFRTFVGLAPKDSRYDMFYLYPVETSWAAGDRQVLCLAGSNKSDLTGSLKGANT
ncbi:MAG: septum formation family protein [Micropruina sp.]